MAIIVIQTDVCRDGFLYDKLEDTDLQVITNAAWDANSMIEQTNVSGDVTARLQPVEDADGDYILGQQVSVDPAWISDVGFAAFMSGNTTKNHVYWEQQTDINGDLIPCP